MTSIEPLHCPACGNRMSTLAQQDYRKTSPTLHIIQATCEQPGCPLQHFTLSVATLNQMYRDPALCQKYGIVPAYDLYTGDELTLATPAWQRDWWLNEQLKGRDNG